MTASSPSPASPAPAAPAPAAPAPAVSWPAAAGLAPASDQSQGAGMAAGLAAVIMWGLAPVATRALVGQLAPLPLLVLRIGLSGLVLLPWCAHRLIRMRRATPAGTPRGEVTRLGLGQLGRLAAAGLLCMVGYNL